MTALLTHRDYQALLYDPITELWDVLDRLENLIEYAGDLAPQHHQTIVDARNALAGLIGPVSRLDGPSDREETRS